MKYCFLTFDIEEFDLPSDYGSKIEQELSFEISKQGTKVLIELIKKHNIRATFFITVTFAKKYPNIIKELSEIGEIACHGYSHKDHYTSYQKSFDIIKNAKKELENISLKELTGFRGPKFNSPPISTLKELGFSYDSTLHPTFLPGYYNNFFKPRKIHKKDNLLIFPISVTPIIRAPFSWYFIRNFGLSYGKICTNLTLLDSDYINVYFHPWEFVNLKKFNIPFGMKNNTGKKMIKILDLYIKWCLKKKIKFVTIEDYIKKMEI